MILLIDIGCLNRNELIDIVVIWLWVWCMVGMVLVTLTWAMIQPPKTSPFWLTFVGIGMMCRVGWFFGSWIGFLVILGFYVVEWIIGKWCEIGVEYYFGVGEFCISYDIFGDEFLCFVE